MKAQLVVECLLDADRLACIKALVQEASVYRPRRGRIWVATFTDEWGKQVWRSTGQSDRAKAQSIAARWQADAKLKRVALGGSPKKPIIRVRPDSPEHQAGLLSQEEVGIVMRLSTRSIRAIERRAFQKLRNHPVLKQFWREWSGRDIEEGGVDPDYQLTQEEMEAVSALARTPLERSVMRKVLRIVSGASWAMSHCGH